MTTGKKTSMRMFSFPLILLVFACHGSTGSVYEQPLPDWHNARAVSAIGSRIKAQDKMAWQSIVSRMTTPPAAPLRSRTVGEAITRWNAQRNCLQIHAKGVQSAGSDDRIRNREIDAFNDCTEMEV